MESMEMEESKDLTRELLKPAQTKRSKNKACLFVFCKYKDYQQFVSAKQMEEIDALVNESVRKADPDSDYTKEELLELFHNAYMDLSDPPMIDKQWKQLGFQSENPCTDLRSSGKLSLENMVYFSKHYMIYYKKMVEEATEYPFIASAINITTLLLIHLNIYTKYTFCPCCGTSFKLNKKVPIREMSAFADFLEEDSWEKVFNELFSLGVMLMVSNYNAKVKSDPTFSILNFREVFVETRKQILFVLRHHPKDIMSIFDIAAPYLKYL